jgi:hypothetical protein
MQTLLPDNARYILRKLSHARTTELKHHPASRQMLLLLVSYPLRLVLEPVDYGRHFKFVLRDVDPVKADIR